MRRCAFLTLPDAADFVIDDDLAREPFAALGWAVSSVPWSQAGVDWPAFDAVIVRSTWDYHREPGRFLAVLEQIASSGVPLFNSLDLIRWNLSKSYLLALERCGVPIVPTVIRQGLDAVALPQLFDQLDAGGIVVKPVVGANAERTFRLDRETWHESAKELGCYAPGEPVLVQPFLEAVPGEGEYSLCYLAGSYSHGVLKVPAPGDFRTQEEHGARILAIDAEASLRRAGDAAIAAVPERPLYARVDLVRSDDRSTFRVMELELIEPSLYLRMDPAAPARFAGAFRRAFDSWHDHRE